MSERSPLDELARRGEQRQQADRRDADAATAERERRLDRRNASSPDVAALQLSPLRWLWGASIWLAWAVGLAAVVLGGACGMELGRVGTTAPLSASDARKYELGLAACIAAVVVFAALPWIVKVPVVAAGRRQCAATERWLASLPFAVTGFLQVVGRRRWIYKEGTYRSTLDDITTRSDDTASVYVDIKVELHPVNAKPPEDEMAKLLAGLGPPFSRGAYRPSRLEPGRVIRAAIAFPGGPDGATVAGDLRTILDKLLVPLHDRYPLASVTFLVDRDGDPTAHA